MLSSTHSRTSRPTTWQAGFVAMLPEIERLSRIAFRDLTAEARADAVADAVVHSLFAYVRLFERGRAEAATASSLAWYSALQIRRGRIAGCRLNSKEPLSRYAQISKGIRVVQLHHCEANDSRWINDIVDSRQTSVADQVAIKLVFVVWLNTLCSRTRRIAMDLARGFSTSEVADKFGVTPGRVSQLRRELQNCWCQFQGEPVPVATN
jgi:hypothetical protein